MQADGVVDIVMLTHNRGDHLQRTLTALRERTPEPMRLIIVDNGSEPDVRNWLWERRDWFHRLILRPTNEYVPAFQYGIDLTESDPYIVSDPDLVVPALDPSWLARLLGLLDRHPDFGMIALDVDLVNKPAHFTPEWIDAFRGNPRRVSDDLAEGNVGSVFAAIRRAALREPYLSDLKVSESIRRAGYRVGWTPTVKALHLGWDDIDRYPEYLAAKTRERGAGLAHYGDPTTLLKRRPPRLAELALAAPILALTRAADIPDAAVLEVTWGEPLLGATSSEVVTVRSPDIRLPLDDGAAAAVVLADPPPDLVLELIEEACRLATHLVIVSTDLKTVSGRAAGELARPGWRGDECRGAGTLALALADEGDRSPEMQERLGLSTIQEREGWLALFAAGAWGSSHARLFRFTAEVPRSAPSSVRYASDRLDRWRPPAPDVVNAKARRRGRFSLLRR
ncbi:MAG TPA: glycosyltransferase [Solirubrobacteraceae bacterium]|jgi:hypothetical protein|nr:glycosyltransferase [Solirubrobacteraceae bacterium]